MVIDVENRTWGNIIDLPGNVQEVFNGFNEYLVIFNDGLELIGIETETGDLTSIVNWASSGLAFSRMSNIFFLPDNSIVSVIHTLENSTDEMPLYRTELVVLNSISYDTLPEKKVITIASAVPLLINQAVAEFNRTNSLYRIEIVPVDDNFEELSLKIIVGDSPDIIHTLVSPFHQWAGRGLFVDLYKFIDADTELSRDDFICSVLKGIEQNGELFQMFPDFSISTIIGHPDIVGSNEGWSFEEFKTVVINNPQAETPLGRSYNGEIFINGLFSVDIESFVNWNTGTVNFDNAYFIELLEFAYSLNKNSIHIIDPNSERIELNIYTIDPNSERTELGIHKMISSGEQIMYFTTFSNFSLFSVFEDLFGGEFVFKGFPVQNGSGNLINTNSGFAITSVSENQEGAWEFIRMLLSEDWQNQNVHGIPTNKNVFNERIITAMEEKEPPYNILIYDDLTVEVRPLAEDQIQIIQSLIDSSSSITSHLDPLSNIIRESLLDFFNDTITAQDAARIIQRRATIFVSEQS
jgi:ABC-type glycerol-3-phosphate transport system substrate-binding protein